MQRRRLTLYIKSIYVHKVFLSSYILNHLPLSTVTALILKFNKIVSQNKACCYESGGSLTFVIILVNIFYGSTSTLKQCLG